MTLTETKPVFDVLMELSPDNNETWDHIQAQASTFLNSVSYHHLAQGKRPDEDVNLTINGESREFRPLSQASVEGQVQLNLYHPELGNNVLLLVLRPGKDPKRFDFELSRVAVVEVKSNENRPRT